MIAYEVRELGVLRPDGDWGRQWETLVQAQPESGFMQSLVWANCRRTQGVGVWHWGVFEKDQLVGGTIAYGLRESAGARLLTSPEGPVIPWEDSDRASGMLVALRAAISAAARPLNAISWRIEPRLRSERSSMLRGLARAPLDGIPRDTLYLDLTSGLEAVRAQANHKARYNGNLALRHHVEVEETADPQAVSDFYALMQEAGARDGFFVEPLAFFHSLATVACPSNLGKFLFASRAGQRLATMFLVQYGGRATYLYGATANAGREHMAGYALQWAAIEAALRGGCSVYDFYGCDPFGYQQHPYAGFSRFKRQFGGQAIRFVGAHDDIWLDPLADALVRAFQEIGG